MTEVHTDTRPVIRTSLIAVGILLILLVLMGTVFRLSGAVIAGGDVSVESRIKQITHPTGGVIAKVLVHDGQHVRKGDLLIRLDSSVSETTSSATGSSLESLLARRARLEAERDGIRPSDERGASSRETMLFDLRRRSLEQSHAQMRERMSQAQQEAASVRSQIASVALQRQLVEKERKGVQDLYDKGLVTITRYTQSERVAVDLEAQADGLRAKLAQSLAQLAELRERDSQLDKDFRSEAGNELAALNVQMGDIQSRAATTADQNRRNEIRSPYDGIVDKLAYTTEGSFLPPGQLVMEIVPQTDRNVVEVRIAPQDIDQVRMGQLATLHFSAFSQQTTPTVTGSVEWISAERMADQNGVSYYRARIGVKGDDLKKLDGLPIRIGMPVEAYIETRSRTILSYLFKPLVDQSMRAFR